jgi:uncharacterized OB-fold protein
VQTPTERPLPIEDQDSKPFWDAARERRLELPRCRDCGKFHFPPRPRCPNCLSPALDWVELSGRGQIYSFTVIHVPVARGFEIPYAVAQVELEEQAGLRVTSNILDCPPEELRIGMPVQVDFEGIGGGFVLPQFRRF